MLNGLDLKIMRIQRGLKGKELAKSLNVSAGYISMVETNREKPSQDMYKKWIMILKGDE